MTDPTAPTAGTARTAEPGERDHRQDAFAASLARLPGIGPATLVHILSSWSPEHAWEAIRSGELVRPTRRSRDPRDAEPWRDWARRVDPEGWWSGVAGRGVKVTWFGKDDFPDALARDPNPPGVLFWLGRLELVAGTCVAIVGTRSATPDGRATAFEMGRDLALAGVSVVSGLALGIDGAAHLGALSAPDAAGCPVGVAASGVDVPYPPQHGGLWKKVAGRGAILSETPPGHPARPWRFPTRNRIIAALARLVVVVESHTTGGSLITAEAAIERGIDVRVVPGPVHSPASAGSNQLLYDGPGPVRSARDVLDALGMLLPEDAGAGPAGATGEGDLDSIHLAVLHAVPWRPESLGRLVARCGLPLADVAAALDVLEARGLVSSDRGWWSRERVKRPTSG